MLQVRDVMYPVNKPLREDMALVDAVSCILDSGYLGLPVVDNNKRVVGFLSEFDCLPYLVTDSYHCDSHEKVADIMRTDPLTVVPGMSVVDLAQQMGLNRPKVYAVVEEGLLVGIVTRSMLMKELNESLRNCKVA
ncbi:CBS domain-containing protein [Neptuniibacter halophilus]|uniref:CBS domain-containing protein n=1 Tax=Neptuniibacter halophilus TaxID=651666 RepID=UPI0025744C10|nr:CBS domain-containing protein [Neptuniibacter halophilus]